MSSLDQLLDIRSLGVFPPALDLDQSLPLQRALYLEYQVHDLLNGDYSLLKNDINIADINNTVLNTLLSQAETLFKELKQNSVEWISTRSSLAVLLLINNNDLDRVINLLNLVISYEIDAIKGTQVGLSVYLESLRLKDSWLLSITFEKLKNLKDRKDTVLKLINSLIKIPKLSHVEVNYWLNLLFDELFEIITENEEESITLNNFKSLFGQNETFILLFVQYLHHGNKYSFDRTFIDEFIGFVSSRASNLLKQAKFPKSNEFNDEHLEEFLQQLTKSSFIDNKLKMKYLEDGIAKTYQSQTLIHSLTTILSKVGNADEVNSAFEVYGNYVEAYHVLNGRFEDVLSILSLFETVLNFKFLNPKRGLLVFSDDEYHYYLKLIEKFQKLLLEFYNETGLTPVDESYDISKEIINPKTNKLSKNLSVLLSSYWSSLGKASYMTNLTSHSIYSLSKQVLSDSLLSIKNSVALNQNALVTFGYLLALSIMRRTKESFKYLKIFLKTLTVKDDIYFKSWHLLALILSVEENKEESFKIISFILNETAEFINDSVYSNSPVPDSLKQIFIQIKITQLAIIESLFGIEQTLDTLPELFELYNQLFKDSLENTVQEDQAFPNTHKKSKSLASVHTLTKIKSIRPHKDSKKQHDDEPIAASAAPYKFKPNHTNDQLVLQKIWLLSSSIYSRANLPLEAEQALLDAENTASPNAETHTALAQLTSTKNAKLALSEFEKALTLKRDSLDAIVGLAQLLLTEEKESLVFIDDKDRVAGIARVKLLLETVAETFEGAFNTEVWWLLSLIYEKFKDKKRLRESLWRSVELEESRAVRKFSSVEGLV